MYSSSGSPPQARLSSTFNTPRNTTPRGRGHSFADLDVELEEKLMAVDMKRSGERFSSGQPRHWDLASEVRPDVRPLILPDTRSAMPPTKLKASPRSPPGEIEKRNIQRLLTKDRFTDDIDRTRTRARVSYAEGDKNGYHSALALEKFLKAAGIDEVWMRGASETKLVDADPAFHNFQDLRQIQRCDFFVSIVNSGWHSSVVCKQELEFARKMHATSTERGVTAPGAARSPSVVVVVLSDAAATMPCRELEFVDHVGHSVLRHGTPCIAGWDVAERAREWMSEVDDETAATFEALQDILSDSERVLVASASFSSNPNQSPARPNQSTRQFQRTPSAQRREAAALRDQAVSASNALQDALKLVDSLRLSLEQNETNATATHNSQPAAPLRAPSSLGRSVLPTATMPFASLLASRYFGTLTHVMGGRMVWSLDISFENLVDPATILEGELVTGINGKVLYTLVNYFPNHAHSDESTAYWARWSSMRIGHEAVESIKCSFDPVQGLIIAEGVDVHQETAFEDGEGALINPYQKYRMLLCADGSMAATLFAGGEWDAAFRAVPF